MYKNYVKKNKSSKFLTILKVGFILFLLFIMSGFKNFTKIEHATFVTAIGVDKSKSDPSKILVTFQMVPPQVTSASAPDIEKLVVTSITSESMETAIASIHNYLSTIVNLSHTRALVIGEELAKEGISRYTTSISSNSMYDTNMFILTAKGTAKEYLESISKDIEVNPMIYYTIIRNSQYLSASTDPITVMEFLRNLYEPNHSPTTPVCRVLESGSTEDSLNADEEKEEPQKDTKSNESSSKSSNNSEESSQESTPSDSESKDKSSKSSGKSDSGDSEEKSPQIKNEIGGIAIYNSDKLVGILEAKMVPYHIMMTSKVKGFYLPIKYTDNNEEISAVSYIYQDKASHIDVNVENPFPSILIKIPLNISIVNTKSKTYDFYNANYTNKIKDEIVKHLENNIYEYLNIIQNDFKVDVEQFSKHARKKFLTEKELDEYKWSEKFKEANIQVKFNANFIGSGLNIKK